LVGAGAGAGAGTGVLQPVNHNAKKIAKHVQKAEYAKLKDFWTGAEL